MRLIRKLENFVHLSADERMALERISSTDVRVLEPHADIISEGDAPTSINLILDGLACRYRLLQDGRRQIVGFFIPGDLCDARMFILKAMDHSIGAVATARVARIDKDDLIALTDSSPRIARALWWNTLVDESIAREWIVNVGRRSALERLAHLFCEFFIRCQAVGLVDNDGCALPLTQSELADALGITTVHVNRTLKALRDEGLITVSSGHLIIHELRRLQDLAFFSANYLHLDREGQAFDARDR